MAGRAQYINTNDALGRESDSCDLLATWRIHQEGDSTDFRVLVQLKSVLSTNSVNHPTDIGNLQFAVLMPPADMETLNVSAGGFVFLARMADNVGFASNENTTQQKISRNHFLAMADVVAETHGSLQPTGTELNHPWVHLVCVQVWPSVALNVRTAQLTKSAWFDLGMPDINSTMQVCLVPENATGIQITELTLRLLAPRFPGNYKTNQLQEVLSYGSSRQSLLFSTLVKRYLIGRRLIPGAVLSIPLLGHRFAFQLVKYLTNPKSCLETSTNTALGEISVSTNLYLESPADAFRTNFPRSSIQLQSTENSVRDWQTRFERPPYTGASKFPWCPHTLTKLREIVTLPLSYPGLYHKYDIIPVHGLLLYGSPGVGKTTLARRLSEEANAALITISCAELTSKFLGESEMALEQVFQTAKLSAPSIIFLDELDSIAYQRTNLEFRSGGGNRGVVRMVNALLFQMDNLRVTDRVSVVGACNQLQSIDQAMRRPGRFDCEVEVSLPTPALRARILHTCLEQKNHEINTVKLHKFAARLRGFVASDINMLCSEAAFAALRERVSVCNNPHLTMHKARIQAKHLLAAHLRVIPGAMRELALEVPSVYWEDVGGINDAKAALLELSDWNKMYPGSGHRIGALPPRAILLYGPPGCSKTLLARALAQYSRKNFFSIKGPELISKWVGESEKAVQKLFADARRSAPSVVFFDEIDGLATTRNVSLSSPSGSQIVAQFLYEMDKVSPSDGVAILGATNRPDLLDSALLRPGRFDKVIYVPAPTSSYERFEILCIKLRQTLLSEDVDLLELATQTKGYTGADLSALIREAAFFALQESLDSYEVAARHLAAAMRILHTSSVVQK
mmetsp:Transcript_20268/g.68998  ORF Transcript_20268/g.68998 Transcript_20268/m.68998 type:complete len:853 (+) Transcript_20268:368-2926(+)|eukprot:CAMPEP_0183793076 /NCGR_PEP_ID=MMETSP0803_2-20130417/2986_1 /TAXON_ID=195967 /ORGANISM="Crustomastix stigmata, Strain CCMP3273" /LENGTH=852 /DNA_ID=CAMNT_0026037449 /DNA_START=319 /DNA_END=2880 /DNA_ORIENTATION=-